MLIRFFLFIVSFRVAFSPLECEPFKPLTVSLGDPKRQSHYSRVPVGSPSSMAFLLVCCKYAPDKVPYSDAVTEL